MSPTSTFTGRRRHRWAAVWQCPSSQFVVSCVPDCLPSPALLYADLVCSHLALQSQHTQSPLYARCETCIFSYYTLHASCGTVYCNRSCLHVGVFVCVWVCYRDNSKLRALIFTKLGLYVKVVTVSSWLNFGRPAPQERGLRRGKHFWLHLATASAQCLRLSGRFFSLYMWIRSAADKPSKTK